jgi:7,8-dihydropterin-6-yl-methyl-4-(beta-D-ribofuranosyl)aminobenzene 5'-phosphate synthase
LITGCSHCGIENIYQKATTISNVPVSHVLGGSHLNKASDEQIETVADFFREENVELYLGHCTGISGYSRLFRLLGDQLKPIYSGCKLEFDL